MEFLQSTWVQISVESSIVKSTMFLLNTDKCFTRLVTVYIVVLKHICLKYFVSQCVYVNVCSFLFGRLCTVCMIISVGTSFLPLQTIALYTKPATYVYLLKGSNWIHDCSWCESCYVSKAAFDHNLGAPLVRVYNKTIGLDTTYTNSRYQLSKWLMYASI